MSAGLWRYVVAHLRHRAGQAVTAGVGIVVAAASFSLLTAAVSTNQVQTRGQVASSFRAAYDILVRPPGTQTVLEARQGLVRPNFATGIFGGISLRQWHTVLGVAGVQVAAPVAYLGYPSTFVRIFVPVDRFLTGSGDQLLRLQTVSVADNGLSRYPGATPYVFITSRPHGCDRANIADPDTWPTPFAPNGPGHSYLACYQRSDLGRLSAHSSKATVEVDLPVVVLAAAIDPVQENKLLGLDQAMTSGDPLAPGTPADTDPRFGSIIPVIASDRSYVTEPLRAEVEQVDPPAGKTLAQVLDDPSAVNTNLNGFPPAPNAAYRRVVKLPGHPLGQMSIPYNSVYADYLANLGTPDDNTSGRPTFASYWSAGPVSYQQGADGHLTPVTVHNDPDTTYSDNSGMAAGTDGTPYAYVPVDNADRQFRRLTIHPAQPQTPGVQGNALLHVYGTFDPTKLHGIPGSTSTPISPGQPGQKSLNAVPLEAYAPPLVQAADPASRTALGGQPLGPSANVGGYVSQPPALLTTLTAAQGMLSRTFFDGANPTKPISVIRVRVAGVTGPDQQSLERIRRVATAITAQTGLQVDITAGSSPEPQLIDLPAGHNGRPALLVTEPWSRKGVAVVILSAVDTKSAALFGLVLAVTIGLLINAALATVRTRRREIGILLATGWSPRHIFGVVLGELALVGIIAGILSAGVAAALISLLHLDLAPTRVLLVPPVALTLAVLAGLVPAGIAARGQPADVVNPAVIPPRNRHHTPAPTRTLFQLATRNLARRPGRTIIAAAGLFLSVTAITALVGINTAYQQVVVGTLLGNYVATAARTVDYLAVALALILAAISIANTLILDHTERAPELATLHATGWAPRHLAQLTLNEAAGIGALGSIPGAAIGATIAALAGAPATTITLTAISTTLGGILLATIAGLIPAKLTTRTSLITTINSQ